CAARLSYSPVRNLGSIIGLGRESLYKALSIEGNPEFAAVLKVLMELLRLV
ncbi:MAG: hypothetical protein ACO3EZ_02640, partial [Prochlorotrichaceae cyanobacterium]